MLIAATALKGYAVEATDGSVGNVSDLLFDDRSWILRWIVVDTGSWLSSRKVLLHPSAVTAVHPRREALSVQLTKAKIEGSPSTDSDPSVTRQMELDQLSYYGWDPMWGGGGYFGGGLMMPYPMGPVPGYDPELKRELEGAGTHGDDGDPHLRSIHAVTGYDVLATDGVIGHVENMLLEDSTWAVLYLVVDTSNWWFGKHVLLSPFAVTRVNTVAEQVDVDVTQAKVKGGPVWDPAAIVEREYERDLHAYYGWRGYGW